MMRKIARNGLITCLALACGATAWGAEVKLVLHPPPGERVEAPIRLAVGDVFAKGNYQLTPEGDAPAIPAVVVGEADQAELVFMPPKIDKPTGYAIKKSDGAADAPKGVAFVLQGENIKILVDGKELGVHRVDEGAKPFLFPLLGPSGERLTRAFPMEEVEGEKRDHPHQRSFWFTHGDVNGVDFWSEMKDHGTIKETGRRISAAGPVLGRLETKDDWIGPDGVKICEDERVLTVYNTQSVRILDFEVTIKATEGPVVFGDTKEGTFGVRVATSMDVDRKDGMGGSGKIRNAEGLEDAATWSKASNWVDYSGTVNDKTVGIAILNSPSSHGFPTHWHVRTYGLFAANPFGLKDFGEEKSGELKLAKGESVRFAHRLILHDGDADAAKIADQYQAYVGEPDHELIFGR